VPPKRPAHYLWAVLIARIYEVFPLLCPNCGGPMRLIAFITHSADIRQILNHIGVESEPPHISPARGPPLWEGMGQHNRPPITRWSSASIGEGSKQWFRKHCGEQLRAWQIQSRLFARGLTIELPRRLKLHKSTMLGAQKIKPYLPSCG
jgi:hypothetical protein